MFRFKINEDDIINDYDRNLNTIVCRRCSTVIFAEDLVESVKSNRCVLGRSYVLNSDVKFDLPLMNSTLKWSGKNETVNWFRWWYTRRQYEFDTIGWMTIDKKKVLMCAGCDLGPLGFRTEDNRKFYVAVERVGYKFIPAEDEDFLETEAKKMPENEGRIPEEHLQPHEKSTTIDIDIKLDEMTEAARKNAAAAQNTAAAAPTPPTVAPTPPAAAPTPPAATPTPPAANTKSKETAPNLPPAAPNPSAPTATSPNVVLKSPVPGTTLAAPNITAAAPKSPLPATTSTMAPSKTPAATNIVAAAPKSPLPAATSTMAAPTAVSTIAAPKSPLPAATSTMAAPTAVSTIAAPKSPLPATTSTMVPPKSPAPAPKSPLPAATPKLVVTPKK